MGENIDCRTVCKIRKEFYYDRTHGSGTRRNRFYNQDNYAGILPGNLVSYDEYNVMEDGDVISKKIGSLRLI